MKAVSRNTIFFLLSISLGIPTLPKPSNPAEISSQLGQAFGLRRISGEVDGKSAVLVVDAGSNSTIISSRLVKVYSFSPENVASTVTVCTSRGTGMYATTLFTALSCLELRSSEYKCCYGKHKVRFLAPKFREGVIQ